MSYYLYPLSTPTGQAIPFDILNPIAHKGLDIGLGAMVSPELLTSENAATIAIILWSKVDIIISFDTVTPIADINSGDLFLPAFTVVQSILPTQYISAIAETEAGKLHINLCRLYDTLATELQQNVG